MMKKRFLCLAAAAVFCLTAGMAHTNRALAQEQPAAAVQTGTMYALQNLSLRAEPSKDSEKLAVVSVNTEVQVLENHGEEYVPVEYEGQKGYVLGAYLTADRAEAEQAEKTLQEEKQGDSEAVKANTEACLTAGILNFQNANGERSEGVSVDFTASDASLSTEEACREAARNLISSRSKEDDSNEKKLKKCFVYLTANFNFKVKPMDHYDFTIEKWPYTFALECFEDELTGDCYGFASMMGVIAKELGYEEPTVIATTEDHAFAIIDGRYYGTMLNNGEDGDTTHTDYKVWHQCVLD